MAQRPRFRNVIAHVRATRPDITDPVAAISSRRLIVGGVIITNPAASVPSDAPVVLRPNRRLRGESKLHAALDAFDVRVEGAVCLDLGASAGGFTRALLDRGARLVYALDAGSGQLRGDLRVDPRVVNLERTNLADAGAIIPPRPLLDVITAALSYISLSAAVQQLGDAPLRNGTDLIGLVKPMFELRLAALPGDESQLAEAVARASHGMAAAGWHVHGSIVSPVPGRGGATEFFVHASFRDERERSSL